MIDAGATPVPMTGGVSSDIYVIEGREGSFVIKRALSKLKVADDWQADLSRNTFEQRYLKVAGEILPGSVPKILHSNSELGYFAMEYLSGSWQTWKALLLAGEFNLDHATHAGRTLGILHRETYDRKEIAEQFSSDQNFHDLRIAPYLLTTGERHPELRATFEAEAKRIESCKKVLVHGDFSPKNILIKEDRMAILDCEVAWYGDPTFDLAFLLNHFFLKALFHSPAPVDLSGMVSSFLTTYQECRGETDFETLEGQVCHLLLLLMLARVDGKSPVEYLTEPNRELTRKFVYTNLPRREDRLAGLCQQWQEALQTTKL